MKAARIEGKRRLDIVEIEKPVGNEEDVIIKVGKVGICGTDLHYWEEGDQNKGWILGHEFSGEVMDPGDREDLSQGDRVLVIPGNPCGECYACENDMPNQCPNALNSVGNGIDGAFSEYVIVRSDVVLPIPEEVSNEEAAMIEPSAVALHAAHVADIKEGQKVLIAGGGIIGILTAMWAKKLGASYIGLAEANEVRLKKAAQNDFVDITLNARDENYIQNAIDAAGGVGFDIYIDCVGNSNALNSNIFTLKPAGKIVMAGFPIVNLSVDIKNFVQKELQMKGSFGYEVNDIIANVGAICRGDINLAQFITKEIALEDVQKTFEDLSSQTTEDVKVLIDLSK
ncbi:MAG: alcohol dehydrogenase catalytic domain-containing protein [Eubacterium sp.]